MESFLVGKSREHRAKVQSRKSSSMRRRARRGMRAPRQPGVRRQSPVCRTVPKGPWNRNITAPAGIRRRWIILVVT
jgi:hypothetical protein